MPDRPDQREQKEQAAFERAGENTWRWSRLSIAVVENTSDLADLQPVVEEIQPEFMSVDIRRLVAGPGAGLVLPEAAIVLAFAVAAHGFLYELGKDLYQGFRAALCAAYQKARTWANGRAYVPLTIQVENESRPLVVFLFAPGMDADTFDRALQALSGAYDGLELGTEDHFVIMEFDGDSGAWRETRRD